MDQTKTTIKKINDSKREIEISIPADEVGQEFEKTVKKYAQRVKIRGFRPGKAPRDIVRQMYLSDIKESVINSLAPEVLKRELKAHELSPLGSPVISNLKFEDGQPLQFTAQIEVWPNFELPEYTKISAKKKKSSVTDKDITQGLEDLQQKSVQYIPVENREVQNEDYVVAEIKGKETKTKKLLPTEQVVILAGHPENESELNRNLLGLKTNEQASFTVTYKLDHGNKKLAGKTIEYDLKIVSIKEKKLPEIDDDFAKDLGDFNSLKDLKAEIKSQILAAKENETKNEMADEIIKIISGRVTFDLPESIVESERMSILRRLLSAQAAQNIRKEDIDKLTEETRKKAEENIKNHIVLKAIAAKESITVTAQDMEEELALLAKNNNIPLAQLKARIEKEGQREEIEDRILLNKTVDFLIENAIIS